MPTDASTEEDSYVDPYATPPPTARGLAPGRKGPPSSAAAAPEGRIAKGADRRFWVALSTSKGVRRWVPLRSAHRGRMRPLTASFARKHAGQAIRVYTRTDWGSPIFPDDIRGHDMDDPATHETHFTPTGRLCVGRTCTDKWKSPDDLVSRGQRATMEGVLSIHYPDDANSSYLSPGLTIDSGDPEILSINLMNHECFVRDGEKYAPGPGLEDIPPEPEPGPGPRRSKRRARARAARRASKRARK